MSLIYGPYYLCVHNIRGKLLLNVALKKHYLLSNRQGKNVHREKR